jgi:penicillin-binding protein 1A
MQGRAGGNGLSIRAWRRWLVRLIGGSLLAAALVSAGVTAWWLRELPPLKALDELQPTASSVLLDSGGRILGEFSNQHRELARLREYPARLLQAVLAAEDWKFYDHFGIDLQGVARAFLRNLGSGRLLQGGSTITQQLTKQLLLTSERTLRRKVLEIILALEIEQTYTKDQILELYLNTIYLGDGAYGMKTAAGVYFGKEPSALTVPECALLAGLIRSPSRSDPVSHPDRARQRRDDVLSRMRERGVLTQAEYEAALGTPIEVRHEERSAGTAVDFTEAVRREVVASVGADALYAGGLRVQTTLNPQIQQIAEESLEPGLRAVEARLSKGSRPDAPSEPLQGSILVENLESGDVLAMVGGRERGGDPHRFNRALQAKRQPGSLFKPFIYTAAIDNGMTGSTVVEDVPVELLNERGGVIWTPQNYDEKHHGSTTLRTALVNSRNIVAVRLLDTLGLDVVLTYAHLMGVESELPRVLSLALGAGEVTLWEMVRAYTCFGTSGLRVEPRCIRVVTNQRGALVLQRAPDRQRVLSETTAYRLADMLHDAVERGTGTSAKIEGLWVGGKTGTTNDSTDAWFIGVAPPLVIGVWVGYDEPVQMGRETGGLAAAPIFREILTRLKGRFEFHSPPRPAGLVEATIDASTGLKANANCPQVEHELFLPGQVPGPCYH